MKQSFISCSRDTSSYVLLSEDNRKAPTANKDTAWMKHVPSQNKNDAYDFNRDWYVLVLQIVSLTKV